MSTTRENSPLIETWLAEAQRYVGQRIDRSLRQKNLEVSPSAIRRYAWGIGDDNPLWCDPTYAAGTRFGRPVAPPTFLYSVDDTVVNLPPAPGMIVLYSSVAWQFLEPVLTGDRLVSQATVLEVQGVEGGDGSRRALQRAQFDYVRGDGQIVARAIAGLTRVPVGNHEGGFRFQRRPHEYSSEQLEAIERAIMAEVRRGPEPRGWEDVEVGDEIVPTVKGPLNMRDVICYYAGNGVPVELYRAHELAYRDPPVFPMRHLESVASRTVGVEIPYDIGHQRIGWIGHALTNWMGDEGFLKALDVRLSSMNIFGDTTWCRGKVVAKRVEGDEPLVDVAVSTENQLGEVTSSGRATVRLPARG